MKEVRALIKAAEDALVELREYWSDDTPPVRNLQKAITKAKKKVK